MGSAICADFVLRLTTKTWSNRNFRIGGDRLGTLAEMVIRLTDWCYMRKSRLFLGLAFFSGTLLALSVILSHRFIGVARFFAFPSIVGCIVFLALYAKATRVE
jgi:hypothetical protein